MAHLSPKYFRLYQEGFERSFGYGKAFIHQDQFSSPERGIFSTPKTPKSILKASRKSSFKSKRRICINESLNQTRRFSSDEVPDDRDTTFQTPEKDQQNQRFHTAPDASIDSDSDFSFGCNEDAIKQSQPEVSKPKSNSNLYTKVNNLFTQATKDVPEDEAAQKSCLSEAEKDYIRKLQKSREQQIYQEMVESRSESNKTQNNSGMTNSQLSSSQNSFFDAKSRELSRKNSNTGLEAAGKSKNVEIGSNSYADKFKASAIKKRDVPVKAKEEKIPMKSRNYEKENTTATKGAQTSPKSQNVIASVQLKEKYESLEERIEQLRQENRELRERLEIKKKQEFENTTQITKTLNKQTNKDAKPQNNTMNRTMERFIPKKSDQMNYVTRILANSKDRENKAKETTDKKIQKTPSTSNLRDPRGPRPSLGTHMHIPQGMSSSCTGFYRNTDQTFKSGRNI